MTTIVMKFGGSTLTTPSELKQVVEHIQQMKQQGHRLVIVPSSIKSMRNDVVNIATSITNTPAKRELDVIDASATSISSALMSIALQHAGIDAIQLTGWQAGIQTDATHRVARIANVAPQKVERYLQEGKVVVVAGYQGIDEHGDITTLGDGGTETVAVALAVALEAARVELYSQVDGVYSADPLIVPHAKKLDELSYDAMLELAQLGARIIHPRAVELAKLYKMPIIVRSLQEGSTGTLLKEEKNVEQALLVQGIAYESDVIRLTVGYEESSYTSLATIFTVLAEHQINVDLIVQSVLSGMDPTVSFSIAKEQFAECLEVLEHSKASLGFTFADFEVGLAKISVAGSGMMLNPGVAARIFDRLRKEEIEVKMVSTSEIKVSVIVPQDDMVRAANALHEEFNLTTLRA
ncbi:aspartate kinase [Caryophanon latum]|uniref:Aspartokinase n=1 Tax=Caryophanon latum TaxID=33977 RepID=A0A1C0Z0Z0_9BACL|nr:aspartate kinase [Caryophanon latum]OCS93073.1 aspartate kinase [Caryophanon latum]